MKARPLAFVSAVLSALLSVTAALAQPDMSRESTSEAAAFRRGLVASVSEKATAPSAAVAQLRGRARPMGMVDVDPQLEFALAALDVGRALVGSSRAPEAAPFFEASEESLDAVLSRGQALRTAVRLQALKQRAILRVDYLGKQTLGMADLDAALELAPEDKSLARLRARIRPAANESAKKEVQP